MKFPIIARFHSSPQVRRADRSVFMGRWPFRIPQFTRAGRCVTASWRVKNTVYVMQVQL